MKLNGISLAHKKNTQNLETVLLDIPEKVKLPLSQHMGAPCDALVKVGDEVKVGQKIGDSQAFMSTPLHSSVSGKVTAISEYLLPNGKVCKAIEIETDGLQTISEEVAVPVVTDRESFIKAIKESGCCGLGGAGFPTYIKLNFNKEKTPVDSLIINGAECEPYITADYRELIENTDDLIDGIKLLMKYLEIPNTYIGIEDNKPEAIKLILDKTSDMPNVNIVVLKSSYPQGAEKVIVHSTTGRIIGEGQLPSDLGVLVMNVSTVGFINRYIKTGMPLIQKRLTVDGDIVENACNLNVLIGTPVSKLLEYAKVDISKIERLISGGPMMGMSLIDIETPVVKTNNAILALKNPAERIVQTNCIRCGSCMSACPLKLMPMEFEKAYDSGNVQKLREYNIMLCMNCGSCSYVCPAKRNLAEKNQLAKGLLMTKK